MRHLAAALVTAVLAAPLPAAPTQSFDAKHLRLKWEQRRWQLATQDGTVIKDFGPAETDARQALRLIHELALDEYGTVGSPKPVMEYWLSGGRAPRGLVRGGLRTLPLDTTGLRVEKMHGQWALREKVRVLFTFENEADANQALDLFTKHRFTHVGLLGLGVPVMTVFFCPDDDPAATPSGRMNGATKFPRLVKNADGSPRIEQLKGKATGLEGVVPAVIPPVGTRTTVSAAVRGMAAPTLTDRRADFWRSQPRLGGPAPTMDDGRVGFDWRSAQMRQDGGEWTIASGSLVVARFGVSVNDARQVLAAIRYYHFTEVLGLGGDLAGRWFAASPASPRGVMIGLSATEVRPDKLEMKLANGRYGLWDEDKLVLPVGELAEDARQLLEVIRSRKIDRVCRVGSGPNGVAILVRSK